MRSETQPYAAGYKLRWWLRFLAIIFIFLPSHREGPGTEVATEIEFESAPYKELFV